MRTMTGYSAVAQLAIAWRALSFFLDGNRVLQVQDDRIGCTHPSFLEALWPVARNKKAGASSR